MGLSRALAVELLRVSCCNTLKARRSLDGSSSRSVYMGHDDSGIYLEIRRSNLTGCLALHRIRCCGIQTCVTR